MASKKFHVCDVISVIHSKVLPPNGWDGCQKLVGHLLGRPDIKTANGLESFLLCSIAGCLLKERHPELASLDAAEGSRMARTLMGVLQAAERATARVRWSRKRPAVSRIQALSWGYGSRETSSIGYEVSQSRTAYGLP